jgi:uncharacterized cupredoxin-like copper-binding protein
MKITKLLSVATAATVLGIFTANFAQAAETVNVTLGENANGMYVKADKTELKAGKVTFNATNDKGSSGQHEMLVVGLSPSEVAHPDSLPYNDAENKFDEERVADQGEVSELDPGQSGSLSIDLYPGTYMLVCNISGHYKGGMYTFVHVK